MYVGLLSAYQGAEWVSFLDRQNRLDEYGQTIFGSAILGSALCHVRRNTGYDTRRTQQGQLPFEDLEFWAPGEWVLTPQRSFIEIGGTGWDVMKFMDGRFITGRVNGMARRHVG